MGYKQKNESCFLKNYPIPCANHDLAISSWVDFLVMNSPARQ